MLAVEGHLAHEIALLRALPAQLQLRAQPSCINLNALLACWPRECLEYIVVHELTHLLEASHSPRFHALVAKALPEWKQRKRILESFQPL